MSDERENKPVLRTELDLQLLTTNSVWGRKEVNPELYDKLRKQKARLIQRVDENDNPLFYPKVNKKGEPVLNSAGEPEPDLSRPVLEFSDRSESLWAELGFFTRDLRLSNLSSINGELTYVTYYLDLASKLGAVDMSEAQIIALANVASVTEPAQSKNGFLRRRMNTLTQEHYTSEMEAEKKNLFGKKRGGD